jgi:HSP20 family protein
MADVRNENRGGRSDFETPQRSERESPTGGLARRQTGGLGFWRDPFSMFSDFDREVHRLFDNLGFGGSLLSMPSFGRDLERGTWSPQIETYERDGKLVVRADLPGMNKQDVKIELNDNILTIEGERKDERRDEKSGWSERSYGHFFRSIALPEGINAENANATFKDGVLEITVDAPRQTQSRGRKIDIK